MKRILLALVAAATFAVTIGATTSVEARPWVRAGVRAALPPYGNGGAFVPYYRAYGRPYAYRGYYGPSYYGGYYQPYYTGYYYYGW